jgi:hypothetical protein
MSTANPFVTSAEGIDFPDTLPEIDELKARMISHIARVSIESAGLPMVLDLLDDLELHRADIIRRSEAPPAWSIPEGRPN